MFDRLTEEQASRIWLGVLGVRDTLIPLRDAARVWRSDFASGREYSHST